MAFIHTTPPQQAIGEVRTMYLRQQQRFGYVPNYARVFSHRTEVMDAWAVLLSSIRKSLDELSFELVTLAAALELGSSYCALAHSSILQQRHYSTRELSALLADASDSPLSPPQRAMMAMARKVVRDPASITDADHQLMRAQGFSDAEIFDVVATAAARSFFAGVVDALGAQPDAAYMAMEPLLRDALTVGRDISPVAPACIDPQDASD